MAARTRNADEAIVLLHGLWLHGLTMEPMRWRLEHHHGFQVHLYNYPSVGQGLGANVRRLAEFLRGIRARRLHLIGHSLGGVLALHTLARVPDAPPGRLVCVGSPLNDSQAARKLVSWRGGDALLGKTARESLLEHPLAAYDGDREVGVIAGDLGMGIGLVLNTLRGPHDGTVAVTETNLPGLTDHLVMPVSHTAMLFSRGVADQAAYFVRHGQFRRAAD